MSATKYIKSFLLIFILSVTLLRVSNTFAQEKPINLTLSPISIQLEAKPGDVVKSQIRIRNNGTEVQKLRFSLGTFIADAAGESPVLVNPTESDKYLDWLKFDNEQVEVMPGEWHEIPFSISIPADAALSYYYIIYFTQSTSVTVPGAANIIGSPAVPVLLNVDVPNVKKELQLVEFITKTQVVESLPKEFEISVKNTGNTHVSPFGNVFIDGQGVQDLAVLPVNPQSNVILPASVRTYKVTWDDGFPLKGDGPLGFIWDFSKADRLRIGRYTAHVLLVYDNGERDVPLESVLTFWVLPWKIIGVGLLVSIFSIFGLWSFIKKIFKKLTSKKLA